MSFGTLVPQKSFWPGAERRLRALDEIGRDNDGREQAYPGVVSRACCKGEDDEEQQGDQQDIGDLRVADAGDRLWCVHANIGAATQ